MEICGIYVTLLTDDSFNFSRISQITQIIMQTNDIVLKVIHALHMITSLSFTSNSCNAYILITSLSELRTTIKGIEECTGIRNLTYLAVAEYALQHKHHYLMNSFSMQYR